jgi:hypothetical protein
MNDTTAFEQRFEERLRSFARAGVQSVDSAAVARAVAVDHPRNATARPARRVFGRWGTRPMSRTSIAAAVVIAVVVVGGAFFVTQRGLPPIGGPGPSASASPDPSQPAVVAPSATPTAEVSPTPDATSLELTWTKVALDERSPRVAWLGDRFVLVDQDTGGVRTSADGKTWHALQPGDPDPGYAELLRPRRDHPAGSFVSWEDDIVGWWNPEDGPDVAGKPPVTARDILRIIRPPAAPTDTTPFKGRIESIGIGPKGIVAQVHSHIDWDAWVASKLGDDWVSRYEEVSFKDGILEITMKQGRGLKVVWADEGFALGDFQDAGFGWYSPDGVAWTAMPAPAWSPDQDSGLGFPTGFGDVVGVSDGFIARGVDTGCSSDDGCAGMWHSSDGLTWRNIGNVVNGSDGEMLPWMGGALVSDGVGTFDFWTSQGRTELPMATELPVAWKQAEGNAEEFSMGPLGLVTARRDYAQILFTRDGVAWDIQAMPAEMEADWTVGLGIAGPLVVVGDRAVLVVLSSGTEETPIRTLWVGSIEP